MSPANDAYNCHSYAWYEQTSLYNNYWINFPVTYINDMSYIEVDNIRPGDIICYWAYGLNNIKGSLSLSDYISHSAIVVSGNMNLSDNSTLSNLEVISKWGSYGVYKHNGNECPYGTDDRTFKYVKVYRPRTTSMVTLNSNIDEISLSKVINANGTIVEHYDMYELNITESTYLDFVISSNNSMSIKLFDEHMQSYYIKLASKDNYEYTYVLLLPIGRYYLRVAYLDNTISGTITTTLKSHNEHLYQYESLNNSYHILKCTCGVTTGNQSRHVIDLSYVDLSGDTRYKPCRYCNCLVDTLVGNHPIIKTVNYKN